MSLRLQLLLVSLAVLVLPLAGYQFVREIEQILRDAEERALIATAASMASQLASFYPARASAPGLYVRHVDYPPVIDGYDDDWALWEPWAQDFGPANAQPVTVMMARDRDFVYMLIRVKDATRDYAQPAPHSNADRILLQLGQSRYLLQTSAPGVFEARSRNGQSAARLRGVWRETGTGYRVELRLPAWAVGDILGFVVRDGGAQSVLATSGAKPRALVGRSRALASRLQTISENRNGKLWLLDSAGWVLASHGTIEPTAAANGLPAGGFAAWIYRHFLRPDLSGPRQRSEIVVRLDAAEVRAALQARSTVRWYPSPANQTVIASVAVPVSVAGEVGGALVLEQASRALLLFTNQAMVRLVSVTLVVFGAVALILLAFASMLSWRVVKLRAEAEQAITPDGRVRDTVGQPRINDELGELRRSFSRVLDELKGHTDYLRTLADKLSHELRTPLAMVQSSLEHLEQEDLDSATRNYAARASAGALRLRQILQAMGEAKRLETSIRDADMVHFDLAALVNTGVENWQRLRPDLNLRFDGSSASQQFYGAPELILRLLDKLLENAADFVFEDGLIEVELSSQDSRFLLSVANEGPPLPHRTQLFESLVSLRDTRTETPHLGLGLYIARLITEFHHGGIRALNTANGVKFEMELRSAPAQNPDARSS